MDLNTIINITNDNNYYYHTNKKFTNFINNTDTYAAPKPQGLWFSIGNDFFQWELKNDYLTNGTKYLYKINLKNHYTTELYNPEDKPILILYPEKVKEFDDEYGSKLNKEYEGLTICFLLDNEKIKKNYSGILFKDYRKNHNHNSPSFNFYDTIDASSGVVWNEKVLDSVEEIK
jgi:hypothetical protein